jgi:hypothetical protein
MSDRRRAPSGSHRASQEYINSLSEAEFAELVARTRAQLRDDPDQREALVGELRRTLLPTWAGQASRFGAILEALRARAGSAMSMDPAELDTREGVVLSAGSMAAMTALEQARVAQHVHVPPETLSAVLENDYSRDDLWTFALDTNLPLPWMYLDFSTTDQEGVLASDDDGNDYVLAGALCWQENESLVILPVGGHGGLADARRSQLRSLLSPCRVVFGGRESFDSVRLHGDVGIGPDKWLWTEYATRQDHPMWTAQKQALELVTVPLACLRAYADGELDFTCPLPPAEREAAAERGDRIGLELTVDGEQLDSAEYTRLTTTAMRSWRESLADPDAIPDAQPAPRPTTLTPEAASLGTVLAGMLESVGDAGALFVRRGMEEGAFYSTGLGRVWVSGGAPGKFSGLDAALAEFDYDDVTDDRDMEAALAEAGSGRVEAVALYGGFVKDTATRRPGRRAGLARPRREPLRHLPLAPRPRALLPRRHPLVR